MDRHPGVDPDDFSSGYNSLSKQSSLLQNDRLQILSFRPEGEISSS